MNIKMKMHSVPSSPGIYIMKGAKERIIYIGKAKNLRSRLRSYFSEFPSLDARKSAMVKEIRGFDYIVTKNELEALVLEANYIKKIKPRYNIILRDDKNYPYIKLTVNEQWPRLAVTRRIVKDGSLYFGPYVPAGSMWETLKFIRRNFTLPSCRYNLEKPFRPCVQYQMGRCLAPCEESRRTDYNRQKYMETVSEVKHFILGEKKELLSILKKKMLNLSDDLRFEEAAKIRDRLKVIEKIWETQRVLSSELGDIDVIGLYREKQEASIFVFFVRNGMIIGQKDFFFRKLKGIDDKELVSNFLEQFYSKEILLPPKIILPLKTAFKIERQWLSSKKGSAVRLYFPGGKKEHGILKMAFDNAYHSFLIHKKTIPSHGMGKTLMSLKDLLGLTNIPKRIEAVDVSNIAGSEAVGAVIVWENGDFVKDDYRLYKIKTVQGIDDFAMIEETARRHFKNLLENSRKLPQLILIDGGKGQLESAVRAMSPALPMEIAAIAKAKEGQPDRVFLRGQANAIPLEPFMASTHLLQRLRDEAHRFAVNYHKKLRTKRTLESPLEKIQGIGKARRLLLLRKFGTIDAVRKVSIEELASLKGMNKRIAEHIKTSLGGTK